MGVDNSIERIARGDRMPKPAFTNPPSQLLDRFSTDVGRKLVYDKEPYRRAHQHHWGEQQPNLLGVASVGENHAVAGHNRRIEARITCDVDLDDPIDATAVRHSLYALGGV